MKKTVAFLLIVTLFTLGATAFISADSVKEDSRFVDSFVLEKIEGANVSNTIKIYNGVFMYLFAEGKTIEEIINDPSILETYYAVREGLGYSYYAERQGEMRTIIAGADRKALSYVSSPKQVLSKASPFLSVKNVYYLDGDSSYDGIYIYYETDKGDYVYYKEYAEAEDGYLFPVKEFYKLAKEVEAVREKNKYGYGGPTLLSSVVDISSYKVTPMNPLLVALGALVGVAAVAVLAVVLVKKKRAKTSS